MRNTCHMQANASFFLCKDTGKFRECFSKPPFFYPERSFCLFAPGFFRRFACLPAPRFCATIIPDRFPATDGQGGAQTTGEQEVPYQRQVRLYLFDSRSGELKASTVARSKDLGPDNTFTWNVAPGSYHAVAWGCSEGERYRVLSSERFPQSRLSVQTLSDGSSVEQKPEHLWYEIGRGLTVTGELQAPHPMDLHKLSNDVRVEVSGLRDEQFPRYKLRNT